MAPSVQPSSSSSSSSSDVCTEDDEPYGIQRADRKVRKPLVEKKRRARINESLQELRTLLADADFNSKMENAEVLEVTVKKVEDILKSRSQEKDALNREASERFAAGYIQCMHEVHTFVTSCPGIDAAVAAELLNHLLECMPLNEDHLQDVLMDLITDTSACNSSTLASPGGGSLSGCEASALSPATSPSSEDSCSDLDEVDGEHHQSSTEVAAGSRGGLSMPTVAYPRFMWRPW